MNQDFARAKEYAKYSEAYSNPGYRMHGARQDNAQTDLRNIPIRTSLLDVGCGRGEMLDFAEFLQFDHVQGVEVCRTLCDGNRILQIEGGHKLPFVDGDFDVVTCNDVIEHVLRGDDELLCREIDRVAAKHILITANNWPSTLADGTDLHINKRPYEEWDALFRQWFSGHVTWIPTPEVHATERWRIDK